MSQFRLLGNESRRATIFVFFLYRSKFYFPSVLTLLKTFFLITLSFNRLLSLSTSQLTFAALFLPLHSLVISGVLIACVLVPDDWGSSHSATLSHLAYLILSLPLS